MTWSIMHPYARAVRSGKIVKLINSLAVLHHSETKIYDYNNTDVVFFDIETTGLDKRKSFLTVLGFILFEEEHWKLTQLFLDSPLDEKEALTVFFEKIQNKKVLLHYNGDSFDLPYLKEKSRLYQMDNISETLESIDVYRKLRPYHRLFPGGMRQKELEIFLQIERKDHLSGKDVVKKYRDYLKTGDKEIQDEILLHNKEDLQGLVSIAALLPLHELEHISVIECASNEQEEIFRLKLSSEIPVNITLKNENYEMSICKSSVVLKAKCIEDMLKHFFPNPKNYYYLPDEDMAIHKSVGRFVDRAHRRQATAENCYQKYEGIFLAAPAGFDELPLFYKRKKTRPFIRRNDLAENMEMISKYAMNIIKELLHE